MRATACALASAAQPRLQSSQRRRLGPSAAALNKLAKRWSGDQRAALNWALLSASHRRRHPGAVLVQAAGSGPGQGPNNAWRDRQQRRLDQQLILGVGECAQLGCAAGTGSHRGPAVGILQECLPMQRAGRMCNR